jgi:hypothetical protein
MNRRFFLKVFGLGAATAPNTAKNTLSGLITPALSDTGVNHIAGVDNEDIYEPGLHEYLYGKNAPALKAALRAYGSIPKFHQEQLKRDAAEDSRRLDVDLASYRSMSPSVKMLHQKQRNYDRKVDAYWHSLGDDGWKAFRRTLGL